MSDDVTLHPFQHSKKLVVPPRFGPSRVALPGLPPLNRWLADADVAGHLVLCEAVLEAGFPSAGRVPPPSCFGQLCQQIAHRPAFRKQFSQPRPQSSARTQWSVGVWKIVTFGRLRRKVRA